MRGFQDIRVNVPLKADSCLIIAVFVSACFNDILRIPGTPLSLFRVLVPVFIVWYVASGADRQLRMRWALLLFPIMALQYALYSVLFESQEGFALTRYLTESFYLLCLLVAFASVRMAYRKIGTKRLRRMFLVMGLIYIAILLLLFLFPDLRMSGVFDNVNNYATTLAAISPLAIKEAKHDRAFIAYLALLVLAVALNDCKLAVVGIAVGAFCMVLFALCHRFRKPGMKLLCVSLSLLLCCCLCLLLNYIAFQLSGHDYIAEIVVDPLRHLVALDPYPRSSTSLTFRTNTAIVLLPLMPKFVWFGIGMGNSGNLLRTLLGEHGLYPSWLGYSEISVHNFFLEFFLDFGFIAILVSLAIAFALFRKRPSGDSELSDVAISTYIASLVFLLEPSGIVTCYLLTTFMFTLLAMKATSRLEGDGSHAERLDY